MASRIVVFFLFLSVCLYVLFHVLGEKGRRTLFQGLAKWAWPLAITAVVVLGLLWLALNTSIKFF